MAKKADIGSKRLVSLAPDGWARWVTNFSDVTVIDLIDAQFQWVSRDSDVLIKASSSQHGEFYIRWRVAVALRYRHRLPHGRLCGTCQGKVPDASLSGFG